VEVLDGAVRWKHLGKPDALLVNASFEQPYVLVGYANSVIALNSQDGREIWSRAGIHAVSMSIAQCCLVVDSGGTAYRLDDQGRDLWTYKPSPDSRFVNDTAAGGINLLKMGGVDKSNKVGAKDPSVKKAVWRCEKCAVYNKPQATRCANCEVIPDYLISLILPCTF